MPFLPVPKAPVPDGPTGFPVPEGINLLVIVPLALVLVPPFEITGPVLMPDLTPVGVVVTTPALVLEDRLGKPDDRGMLVTAVPAPVDVVLSVQVVSTLDEAPAVTTAVTVDGRCVTVEICTLVISLTAVAGYPGIPTPPVTVSKTVAMTVSVWAYSSRLLLF